MRRDYRFVAIEAAPFGLSLSCNLPELQNKQKMLILGTVAAVVEEVGQPFFRTAGGETMFRYEVVSGTSAGEATVVISGDAVFTHSKEIDQALSEALETCDNLTVDVGAAKELDLTFRVLLCSLHRRSELINKTISVRDTRGPGGGERRSRYARVEGCLFKDASELCSLWHGSGAGKR